MIEPDWDALVNAALAVRAKAYAPYSSYAVGAALLATSGVIHVGCNVENASYPVCICAERVALSSAVANSDQTFDALVIATRGPKPGPPCGVCRQALREFCQDLPILLVTPEGARERCQLRELLPGAFDPAMLVEDPSSS